MTYDNDLSYRVMITARSSSRGGVALTSQVQTCTGAALNRMIQDTKNYRRDSPIDYDFLVLG